MDSVFAPSGFTCAGCGRSLVRPTDIRAGECADCALDGFDADDPVPDYCPDCDGEGTRAGATCAACEGMGSVREVTP